MILARILLFATALSAFASILPGQAFRFAGGSYEQALAQAAGQKKMLLLMTTSSVSEASTVMVEEVMADEKVGRFFNQHFLGWVLDADPLAPEFQFRGFRLLNIPEYIFIDAKGEVQYRASGFQTAEEMLEVGKKAIDPANHASAMETLYQAGKRDPEFMQRYIFTMNANGKPVKDVAQAYLATLKPEALMQEPNWKITSSIVDDAASREVRHVIENYARYCEKFDENAVRQFLLDVYNLSFARAVKTANLQTLRDAHPVLEKIYAGNDIAGIRATVELNYLEAVMDWDAYRDAALALFSPSSGHDAAAYNDAAANFFYHVEEPAALETALSWVELSLGMDRQAWNLDTKAALLSKLGRKDAALQAAREAVKMAEDNPETVDPISVEFSLDLLKNEN